MPAGINENIGVNEYYIKWLVFCILALRFFRINEFSPEESMAQKKECRVSSELMRHYLSIYPIKSFGHVEQVSGGL